jgi:predicted transcriptional regulator
LRHLTSKLFKGSAELLFTHLVSDQKLSAKQIRNMRALLKDKSQKGEN